MSQILRRFYGVTERRLSAERVAAATRESEGWVETATQKTFSSPAGDERKLRGIPCLSRGVGGVSPGTSPVAALMRKQPREAV